MNTKPVSGLQNYDEVLREVEEGKPVLLTRDGRVRYALVDINDYERAQATLELMDALAIGIKSGKMEGWLTAPELESLLDL